MGCAAGEAKTLRWPDQVGPSEEDNEEACHAPHRPAPAPAAADSAVRLRRPRRRGDAATAKTYTLTRTFGPFDGAARPGWDPNAVPDGGAALFVHFRGDDTAVRGTATINRKTSHGTSKKVLTLGRQGVAFDSERGFSEFYAFVDPTGKRGWNSVTLTATCRVA